MMPTEIDSINFEEVIFYIDLTSDIIEKNQFIKEINEFIQNKKNYYNNSSFGIVIFQEEDNPICVYDKNDSKSITNIIEEKWDLRPKDQSYIENGLFEILSYVFRKSRRMRKVYRVIVISDTPSVRSEEYHQAVYDLIIKSKKFSTIVDIIRVGNSENYEDDLKLKVITSETHGGLFYCNDNQFSDVFSSLIKSKLEFNVIETEESRFLSEDKTFYERLAADLISLDPDEEEICSICELELCPVCGAYSDENHKCFNCGTKFHGCCIARYSITNNIGFKHIFRCPQCSTLLKLDENFVNLVFEEDFAEGIKLKLIKEKPKLETKQKAIETKLIEEIVEKQQFIEKEVKQERTEEKVLIDLQDLPPPPPLKKIRVGGYFGRNVEVDINSKNNTKKPPIRPPPKKETPLSITNLKPPKKRATMKFCKICGCSVKYSIVCPNCGANID